MEPLQELDIGKLVADIEEGYNSITRNSDVEEDGYMIIGDSRAGKTTLAAFLAGFKLIEKKKGKIDVLLELEKPEDYPHLKISSANESETKIPVLIKGEILIIDTAGFGDTRLTQELANAFHLQRIFEVMGGLKLVLVVPYIYIAFANKDQFFRCMEHFAKLFNLPLAKLKNCLIIVFSMVPSNNGLEPQDLKAEIEDAIKTYLNINPSNKRVIELMNILKDSIELFFKPPFPDMYYNQILNNLRTKGSFLKKEERNSINVVISQRCKENLVQNLFKRRSDDLIESLKQIAIKIQNISDGIVKNSKTIDKPTQGYFKSFKNFIGSLLTDNSKEKDDMKNLQKLFGLNTFLIFSDFFRIILDENLSTQEFIQSFEKQIDKLFEGFEQFSDEKVNELHTLKIQLKQRVKHMEFLDKAYKGEDQQSENIWKEMTPYRTVFTTAKTAMNEAMSKGFDSFILDMNSKSREYYAEGIELMEVIQNQHKKDFKLQIALGNYRLGVLDFENNNKERAIHECLKSLDLNANDNQVYRLINSICESSPNLLGFVSNKKNIVENLFTFNNQEMNNKIQNIQDKLKEFFSKEEFKVEYLNTLESLWLKQKELENIGTPKNLPILSQVIQYFYENIQKMKEKESFDVFFKYLDEVFQLYLGFEEEKAKSALTAWKQSLLAFEIQAPLFNKVKTFSVMKLSQTDNKIENYQKLVDFTMSNSICNNGVPLANDPEAKKVKILAYDYLAKLFLEKNDLDKSFEYCLKALEGDSNLSTSLKRIDDVYFKKENCTANSFDFSKLLPIYNEQILKFNIEEYLRTYKKRVVEVLEAFKNRNTQFFNWEKGCKEFLMIDYLNDLRRVFDCVEHIQQNKKIESLFDLYGIIQPYFKNQELEKLMKQTPETICEKNLRESKTMLKIEGIVQQYNYLKKLDPSQKKLDVCFEDIQTKTFYLGIKEANDNSFEDKVSKFPLIEGFDGENYEKYYTEVLKLTNRFTKNYYCMKISSLANFEIAKRKIEENFFEEAINFDGKFRELCKNSDENRKFYTQHTKIREIYQNFADFYQKKGDLSKELEFLELRGNHLRIQKILKCLKEKHFENPNFLIKLGDYYKKIDQGGKAIKYYNYASGMVYDLRILADINKKIHEILSGVGAQGPRTLHYQNTYDLLNRQLEFPSPNTEELVFKGFLKDFS